MSTNKISSHFGYSEPYYKFCREEQNIVSLLYSILLNNDENIKKFLKLFNVDYTDNDILNLEIYVEYSYIRDLWSQFTVEHFSKKIKNNELKKEFISSFIKRKNIKIDELIVNSSIENFNKYFGCNSKKHIQSPSNWRVNALKENILDIFSQKEDFLELCKFKWSFNIKPDLVLKLGRNKIICVEAKLESGESSYPSAPSEKKIWDKIFGKGLDRVKQTKLQEYMFSEVLGINNVELFIIDKSGSNHNSKSWSDLFDELRIENSFVSKFVSSNKYLQ